MILIHEIEVAGKVVGYARYNTVSDLWSSATWPTFKEAAEGAGMYACCRDEEAHPVAVANLWRVLNRDGVWVVRVIDGADDFCTLRWCGECKAIVTPPFDGYEYHHYGCPMKPCKCRELDPQPSSEEGGSGDE